MKPLRCTAIVILVGSVMSSAQQPTSQTADQTQAVAGSNAFAGDLYAKLGSKTGNLFFSPESISAAFAMAFAGAQGQTASQMAHVFHYTLPPDRLHPAMGALLADMNTPNNDFELHVANALWAQKDENFLESYLKQVQSAFGAGFRKVDFKSSPDAVRGTINHWVEQQTKDKIKDLLPPGAVKASSRLVLTNAIYFKGTWVEPFEKADTRTEAFHVSSSQSVQAPLMHRSGPYRYYDGGTFQMLDLPYKGSRLSMIVLLPKKTDGLAALEESFTSGGAGKWIEKLGFASKVILTLPRFTMTQQFELGGTLAEMGMPLAFSGSADFSGITGKPGFFISAAIHKAFVDVNETGTVAAAATGLTLSATAMRQEPPPIVFRADHPFLFLIHDSNSGSILFLGRVTDPTK